MNPSVTETGEILTKVLRGGRPSREEAVSLCREGTLLDLASAAGELVRRVNPAGRVGYIVNKTILYSNVCRPQCPFCEGTVTKESAEAFTRTPEEVAAEAAEAAARGATQVILQGGHRDDLPWEYYPSLIRTVKKRCPEVQVAAFSPSEIATFGAVYRKSVDRLIGELKEAGLDAMLGGGSPSLRTRIPEYRALLRDPWPQWREVVLGCAAYRIPMAAPFVFGFGETAEERVEYLFRVREVQDEAAAAGFPVFRVLEVFTLSTVSGLEYLRMLALARILVPNVARVASNFLYQGAKVAQVALDGGADDMGGTYMEYDKAELAAGRVGAMTASEMERLISVAGRIPARRHGL
ncbi:MAG TPA: radical SAM protein [Symbiobacteriaceae bacterium]